MKLGRIVITLNQEKFPDQKNYFFLSENGK